MLTNKSRSIAEPPNSAPAHAAARVHGRPKAELQNIRGSAPCASPELCFIRLKEVLLICGKSRSSVYASIRDGNFPAPVKVGGRSSAWVKSEVLQWAQGCIDCSRIK